MSRLLATLGASLIAAPLLLPVAAPAQDVQPLETLEQRFSYMVGLQLGQRMMEQGLGQNLDVDAFAQALRDTFAGHQPRLSMEEMQATVQEMQAAQQGQQDAAGAEAMATGEAFLLENAEKEGVQTTTSGLQYKVIEAGEGDKATAADSVRVHYEGRLLDGKVFDSSFQRGEPAVFGVGQVIPGWQEALQLMSAGAKYEVWIPSGLAYGPQGAGADIGPNETLNFTIELIEIIER
jgi:FKBP-type peptidyl-prolyl cis-trans isomerase FklB